MKFALPNVRKFQRLSRAERSTLLQIMILLPVTALALRLMGLHRWQSILARWAVLDHRIVARIPEEEAQLQAQATARLVASAARHGLWRGNCLEQSLVLWWLLRRRGLVVDLRIGVRREADQLHAHAWVEHQGLVLNEGDDHTAFIPFDRAIVPLKMRSP